MKWLWVVLIMVSLGGCCPNEQRITFLEEQEIKDLDLMREIVDKMGELHE